MNLKADVDTLPRFISQLSPPKKRLNVLFSPLTLAKIWNLFPIPVQVMASTLWGVIFSTRLSALMLPFFAKFNGLNKDYMAQFISEEGNMHFTSFQNFFTRKLLFPLAPTEKYIWPCEGYICDFGKVSQIQSTLVKGNNCTIEDIFLIPKKDIPRDYYFVNIFLHNHSYHRVHAPLSGKIVKIERIPGKLNLLRPWLYTKKDILQPAIVNDRINFSFEDEENRIWLLSLVAGMGVGCMELSHGIEVGSQINVGQEIALFRLGSTCCLVTPLALKEKLYLDAVPLGETLRTL